MSFEVPNVVKMTLSMLFGVVLCQLMTDVGWTSTGTINSTSRKGWGAADLVVQQQQQQQPHHNQSMEAAYPKQSRVDDFVTYAQECEVHKHDRMILEGILYINDLTPQVLQSQWTPTGTESPKLCLNIYVCNRRIPYINAMMMSLMTSQSPQQLLNYAKINLLNTERRPHRMRFDLMASHLATFPFVTHYNFSALEAQEQQQAQQQEQQQQQTQNRTFREQFLLDSIRGLQICAASQLPWCLMMEEDAVVANDFIHNLQKFVIGPFTKDKKKRNKISALSLYAYYNKVWNGDKRLADPVYSSNRYEQDRAKTNAERRARGMEPYQAEYKVVEQPYSAGTVAQLLPLQVVKELLQYLKSVSAAPETDADVYMNREFPKHIKRTRRQQVEPSLVNHIGYYSERMLVTEKGRFSQLNTDVRFMLDAGT